VSVKIPNANEYLRCVSLIRAKLAHMVSGTMCANLKKKSML